MAGLHARARLQQRRAQPAASGVDDRPADIQSPDHRELLLSPDESQRRLPMVGGGLDRGDRFDGHLEIQAAHAGVGGLDRAGAHLRNRAADHTK